MGGLRAPSLELGHGSIVSVEEMGWLNLSSLSVKILFSYLESGNTKSFYSPVASE